MAACGGNREKQCVIPVERLPRKENHKGEGTNAFHVYCEHRRSGLSERFTNEIMKVWAAEWGMLSPEERAPFTEEAKQVRKNAASSRAVQINKLRRQIDKMNRMGLSCGAVVIPPFGQPTIIGKSPFISFLGADVLQREFQPHFHGSVRRRTEQEELVEKMNAVAERDLGMKKFPYAGVMRGQFQVSGVPPEMLPVRKPTNYGKDKLRLLLNADVRIRRVDEEPLTQKMDNSNKTNTARSTVSPFTPIEKVTQSAPHLVAEKRQVNGEPLTQKTDNSNKTNTERSNVSPTVPNEKKTQSAPHLVADKRRPPQDQMTTTRSGRSVSKKKFSESFIDPFERKKIRQSTTGRSVRKKKLSKSFTDPLECPPSKQARSKYSEAEQDAPTETKSKEGNPGVNSEPLSPEAESQDVDVKLESPQAVDVKLEPCDPASMVKLEERVMHHSNGQLTEDEKIPLTIPRDDNSEQESHPEIMQMCLSCGAGLPQFDLMAEINHVGEKLHVCEQCGSAFAIYLNMVHHMMMLSHVGCKPIRCQNCGQCFQKGSLPHL